MRRAWLGIALCAGACAPTGPDAMEPLVPSDGPLALELFFAVRDDAERVWLGALAGGDEEQVELFIELPDGDRNALELGPLGSVDPTVIDVGAAEVVRILDRDGDLLGQLRIRDASSGRELAVHPDLGGAGSVPNDLLIVGPSGDGVGLVVRSGDNAISLFDLSEGIDENASGIRLPSEEGALGTVPANPWFAVPLDVRGHEVAVTAFAQSKIYLVDLDARAVNGVLESKTELVLDEPHVLASPVDVDGDGRPESEVERFVPRSPQGIAADGDDLWVAFSGFFAPRLSADRPPVYLPAVLSRWSLEERNNSPRSFVLPLANPQEVRVFDRRVYVVCSGVIDPGGPAQDRDDSGIVVIGLDGQIERTIRLSGFAPSSLVVARTGELWVSSLLKAELIRMSGDGELLERIALNDEPIDSVFRLTEISGGLIAAPSFNTDRLHIIDPIRVIVDGPPFFGPLVVGPGRPLFDGLQVIARRPGRPGVDFLGPDLFALSGIASRIVPIELRKVIGP